jgi:hypothetical protein
LVIGGLEGRKKASGTTGNRRLFFVTDAAGNVSVYLRKGKPAPEQASDLKEGDLVLNRGEILTEMGNAVETHDTGGAAHEDIREEIADEVTRVEGAEEALGTAKTDKIPAQPGIVFGDIPFTGPAGRILEAGTETVPVITPARDWYNGTVWLSNNYLVSRALTGRTGRVRGRFPAWIWTRAGTYRLYRSLRQTLMTCGTRRYAALAICPSTGSPAPNSPPGA